MNKKACDINEHSAWQEMTTGCEIYEGGTSRLRKTGEWRSKVPSWDPAKCKQCLLCTPFCPDSSIPVKDGKRGEFDYDHCKAAASALKSARSRQLSGRRYNDEHQRQAFRQ